MASVKQFYDQLQFPGHYTASQLSYHRNEILNPYLAQIDRCIQAGDRVLDVGCGTGLISNLFADRHANCSFTAIDFANSIDYARRFARDHGIKNVKYIKQDFMEFKTPRKFDLIICQGVLHHMPNYRWAAAKLDQLLHKNGRLVLAVYHPWGKILKKFLNIDYKNHMLYQDQELVPYETAFNPAQVRALFPQFQLRDSYPGHGRELNICVHALLNSRNGGLTTYILEKNHV